MYVPLNPSQHQNRANHNPTPPAPANPLHFESWVATTARYAQVDADAAPSMARVPRCRRRRGKLCATPNYRPDSYFLDILMPGLDGYEASPAGCGTCAAVAASRA